MTDAGPLTVVESQTPIDRYLAEQGDLSAVERFARHHDGGADPVQARYYRDLIPLSAPGPGQQYGFEVSLDACTGCKACVTACHSLNGLDPGESWRSVGLLHGGSPDRPRQQVVTTACHHCVDPACLNGCPVNAYEKDPGTGIVTHLPDQCFGCGYCVLTCPYEVPRLDEERGIVRKCDMCAGRLASGEAPACVQACPNGAIRISVVETRALAEAARAGPLVPGAPPSDITVPATTYRSRRGLDPDLRPADHLSLRPARSHPPLAVFLVLSQLSVGTVALSLVLPALADLGANPGVVPATAGVGLGAGLLALVASLAHLGRPRYAFRAVLGVRRSWLSREILAFVTSLAAAALYVALAVADRGAGPGRLVTAVGVLATAVGGTGVACSVMIYAVTHRSWWRASITGAKFTLTAAVGGLATTLATSLVWLAVAGGETAPAVARGLAPPLAGALAAATALKLGWEASVLRHLPARAARSAALGDLARTAHLLA
ncbi:MAG: DmsC/YnfH family molybdoenzyme membrane anchor subunit, partial [Acidimicrobiales bacterium]